MSITPQELLQGAKAIAAIDSSEVQQRNAISRLYYAVYHRCQEFIAPDRKDRNLGQHKSYLAQLDEHNAGTIERWIGIKLGSIYSSRLIADYQLNKSVEHRDYAMQLTRAEEVFKQLNSPPPKTSTTTSAPTKPTLRIIK